MGREDGRSHGETRRSNAAKRQGQKGQTGKPPGHGFAETERASSTFTLNDISATNRATKDEHVAPVMVEGETPEVFKVNTIRFLGDTDNAFVLSEHAKHVDPDIRCAVAKNPATPEAAKVLLRDDPDIRVRSWATNGRGEQLAAKEIRNQAPSHRNSRMSPRPAPSIGMRFPVLGVMGRVFRNIFRF